MTLAWENGLCFVCVYMCQLKWFFQFYNAPLHGNHISDGDHDHPSGSIHGTPLAVLTVIQRQLQWQYLD